MNYFQGFKLLLHFKCYSLEEAVVLENAPSKK